ncbi:hypothetical protein [Salipiger bermudensis]|uniref:hypothetical protein n=1 Tax=Salipiger bermudensis TaxID=344736 RepID=UPI001CD5770F|nr:hypothetical protein [Salipiger bermudensis]MCA0961784.1 hypothetical protein [Salipiger bermudensis]
MTLRSTLRLLCLAGVATCLGAGHAAAETLAFSPAPEEERTYHTEISVRSGEGEESFSDTTYISALTRFRVTDLGSDEISLRIFPDWFAVQSAGAVYNSALGDAWGEVAPLMQNGLDATVERDTGRLGEVQAHGDTDLPQDVVQQMQSHLRHPGAPTAIAVEEGWETVTDLEGIPDITLTVTEVSDASVHVSYLADHEGLKLSGLAVIERDTGWVERQVMTIARRFEMSDGEFASSRQTIAIAPLGSDRPVHADWAREPERWNEMRTSDPAPLEPRPDEAEIFADAKGTAEAFDRGLGLALPLDIEVGENAGRFELGPLRAFEGERDLGIDFIADAPLVIPAFEGDAAFRATTLARLTGLGDAQTALDAATALRGEMRWFPTEPFVLTLRPDADGRAEVSQDGVTATLAPSEDGYSLEISGRPHDRFALSFPGGSGVQGKIYAGDRGPDWLSPSESQARLLAASDPAALHIALRADEVPQTIALRVDRFSQDPAAVRQVVFQTERGARLDPDREPTPLPLFRDGPPPTFDTTAPDGLERAALRFRLSALQAPYCDMTLEDAEPLAGHELAFVVRPHDSLDGSQIFELRTDDRRRGHFYGQGDETAVLACSARVTWQPAEIALDAERPWLIDRDALGLEGTATVADLTDRWRFVDSEGTPLTLVAPEGGAASRDATLAETTFDDGTLRVTGRPVRIERATLTEEDVTRRFDVTFPDLPAPYTGPSDSDSDSDSDRTDDTEEDAQ